MDSWKSSGPSGVVGPVQNMITFLYDLSHSTFHAIDPTRCRHLSPLLPLPHHNTTVCCYAATRASLEQPLAFSPALSFALFLASLPRCSSTVELTSSLPSLSATHTRCRTRPPPGEGYRPLAITSCHSTADSSSRLLPSKTTTSEKQHSVKPKNKSPSQQQAHTLPPARCCLWTGSNRPSIHH